MSDTHNLAIGVAPGLSLKACVFGFLGSTTALTLAMMIIGNLR